MNTTRHGIVDAVRLYEGDVIRAMDEVKRQAACRAAYDYFWANYGQGSK